MSNMEIPIERFEVDGKFFGIMFLAAKRYLEWMVFLEEDDDSSTTSSVQKKEVILSRLQDEKTLLMARVNQGLSPETSEKLRQQITRLNELIALVEKFKQD